MCAAKNRLFAKYGHECEITSSWEDLPMFQSGGNILTQIKRLFVRARMASELNNRGNRFLRSQKAVEKQHRIQMKYLHVVHPFSAVRKWWETYMIVVLATAFVSIPMNMAAFNCPLKSQLNEKPIWKWFRLIVDLNCCSDVLMNFFTGYCDTRKNEVVLNPNKIVMRYFFTYFIFDLLSSVPTHIDLFIPLLKESNTVMAFLQYAGAGKAFRIFSFHVYCRRMAEAFNINFALYKVTLTLFWYVLFIHLITCINMVIFGGFVGISPQRYDPSLTFFTWKENGSLIGFTKAYLGTYYRTVHLVSHSAPGIPIVTDEIKIYVVFVWIVSKVMFFYLISQLLEVVATTRSSSNKYKEMVRQLREYMRHKQLPESLQRRLIGYYEFRFQKSYFRESEILNSISGQLRQEIVMHSCRKLVENVEFFKNLPLPLIIRIVSALATDIYLANDVVIKANTFGNCMFFIASGCVAMYTKHGFEVCHLEDGDYFGEIAMVKQDCKREASVVAIQVCELYRLDRKEFVRAILPYPDLMDKIKKIAFVRLEHTQYIDERAQRSTKLY